MDKKDIFISYSSKDYEYTETLYRELTGAGLSCWMTPEALPTGSDYQDVFLRP